MKCLLLVSDLNQNQSMSTNFVKPPPPIQILLKNPQIQILLKTPPPNTNFVKNPPQIQILLKTSPNTNFVKTPPNTNFVKNPPKYKFPKKFAWWEYLCVCRRTVKSCFSQLFCKHPLIMWCSLIAQCFRLSVLSVLLHHSVHRI